MWMGWFSSSCSCLLCGNPISRSNMWVKFHLINTGFNHIEVKNLFSISRGNTHLFCWSWLLRVLQSIWRAEFCCHRVQTVWPMLPPPHRWYASGWTYPTAENNTLTNMRQCSVYIFSRMLIITITSLVTLPLLSKSYKVNTHSWWFSSPTGTLHSMSCSKRNYTFTLDLS